MATAAAAAAVAAKTTTTTTISPIETYSDCDQWLENVNVSQKHCETCHPKRKFISIATFNKKVKLSKPGMISKWRDVPIKDT